QLEEPPQQCRLVHATEEQDVARDGRLDQRIADVARPTVVVAGKRRRPGVAALEEKLFQRKAESRAHFGERPVRQVKDLEASGQTFGETALDQQRSGAE